MNFSINLDIMSILALHPTGAFVEDIYFDITKCNTKSGVFIG